MPNIKPISDLRNYAAALSGVREGSPLFLTRNGRGCYAVLDINEEEMLQEKAAQYDRMKAQLELMCDLTAGRRSGETEGWISATDVRAHFRERANEQ